jgi:hypothetical protein
MGRYWDVTVTGAYVPPGLMVVYPSLELGTVVNAWECAKTKVDRRKVSAITILLDSEFKEIAINIYMNKRMDRRF